MTSYTRIIIIFLSIALNTDTYAQYKKVLKGERSPFDTAVLVQIKQYRLESTKLESCDTLIDRIHLEISSLYKNSKSKDSTISTQLYYISKQSEALQQKDTTITRLSDNYNELYSIATAKTKWYRRSELWMVVGLLLGVVVH